MVYVALFLILTGVAMKSFLYKALGPFKDANFNDR